MEMCKLLLIASLLLGSTSIFAGESASHDELASTPSTSSAPMSIAFIAGKDISAENSFFAAAADYYRFHPRHSTDRVVVDVNSLAEIRSALMKRESDKPWQRIVIVAHGSRWTGLDLPLAKDWPRRTDHMQLQAFLKSQTLAPIPVDENTTIEVRGCGIGQNIRLTTLLADYFGGTALQPKVAASNGYVTFVASPFGYHQFEVVGRDLVIAEAQTIDSNGSGGQDLTSQRLAESFKEAYPNVAINWTQALERRELTSSQAAHSKVRSFTIDALGLAQDIERVGSVRGYVRKHPHLQDYLQSLGIARHPLRWRTTETDQEGVVKLTATVTIVTVFEPAPEYSDAIASLAD